MNNFTNLLKDNNIFKSKEQILNQNVIMEQ